MAAAAATGLAQAAERLADGAPGAGVRSAPAESQSDVLWKPVLDLSCELTVDLPLPGFKIADLLKLRKGSIINAHWRVGRDVPLCLNATLVGWIEFEVVGVNLAVRLTELA
jgi:flagellar motor switch/type III secretory pathway protein FliN